mgnify:CR=1 FL=1
MREFFMTQQQSRTDQMHLFAIPSPDPSHGIASAACDRASLVDSRPPGDEELDPVHTYEFADHSLEVDRQIRSQRR